MKTETVKRIYTKMLKFKITQDEHANKMKLIRGSAKRYKLLILMELQ